MAGVRKKAAKKASRPRRRPHNGTIVDQLPDGTGQICVAVTSDVQDSLCVETIGSMRFLPSEHHGFSVWFYSYGDGTSEAKIHECDEALTWRSAARVLLLLDEYVIDPLDCSGGASGVDDFACPLLLACWSRELPQDGRQAMFAFSDDELQLLWGDAVEQFGASMDDSADLEDDEEYEGDVECVPPGKIFVDMLKRIGRLMAMGGVGPCSLECLASLLSCDQAENDFIAKLIHKLERHAATNGIPRLLARESPEYLVATETLVTLLEEPHMEDCRLAVRLAYSWTVAERKPIGMEIVHNMRTDSEWAFLRWLFSSNIADTISAFRERHPAEADVFVQWIAGKRQSAVDFTQIVRNGNRGGCGRSFGLAVKQREIGFCEYVLAAAKEAAGETI